jgi:hypothetical protein
MPVGTDFEEALEIVAMMAGFTRDDTRRIDNELRAWVYKVSARCQSLNGCLHSRQIIALTVETWLVLNPGRRVIKPEGDADMYAEILKSREELRQLETRIRNAVTASMNDKTLEQAGREARAALFSLQAAELNLQSATEFCEASLTVPRNVKRVSLAAAHTAGNEGAKE